MRFLSRGPGGTLLLYDDAALAAATATGIVLDSRLSAAAAQCGWKPPIHSGAGATSTSAARRMRGRPTPLTSRG